MMGRKPDLPCDIEQVVDLLGIEVIRDTGTQLHCRCPFCADRKAHMNVKIRDNVFRCNRCGKGGGILHLYAEFCEVNLHTAYEELCKMFGSDSNEKCCPHYVGVHEGDEVVCLTEGVMKADIAYNFALGTSYECGFVGLTGVTSYSQFERALEELNSIGVVRINIMVDSDYQAKEEVRKARDRYIEMGVAAGFEVAPITWSQKRKGVDDLYKHLFRNK